MQIYSEQEKRVVKNNQNVLIQIKPASKFNKETSKSLTIKDAEVDEVFSLVNFLFESLSTEENPVTVTFFKENKQ